MSASDVYNPSGQHNYYDFHNNAIKEMSGSLLKHTAVDNNGVELTARGRYGSSQAFSPKQREKPET